jgi:hypothetical protein
MGDQDELIGQRFGSLVVTGPAPSSKDHGPRYFSRCDCGGQAVSYRRDLIRGNTKTCGSSFHRVNLAPPPRLRPGVRKLHRSKQTSKARREHRLEHISWVEMRRRCCYPKNKDYRYYGARGISICDRWRHSFENFLADMGPRPTPAHTLDRINVNGHYEPGNVRWATRAEQARNKRPRALQAEARP